MGGVAGIVQDNIGIQLHDLLDVQVALSIDRKMCIRDRLETLPEMAQNRDALFRALLAGDILYAAPADKRADISAQWERLHSNWGRG